VNVIYKTFVITIAILVWNWRDSESLYKCGNGVCEGEPMWLRGIWKSRGLLLYSKLWSNPSSSESLGTCEFPSSFILDWTISCSSFLGCWTGVNRTSSGMSLVPRFSTLSSTWEGGLLYTTFKTILDCSILGSGEEDFGWSTTTRGQSQSVYLGLSGFRDAKGPSKSLILGSQIGLYVCNATYFSLGE
jgi:hypothetical protein